MSRHLYLGPYIECTYRPATRVVHVQGCTVATCESHPRKVGPNARGKFCSACGGPNGPIPIEVPDLPDRYEVVGDALFEMNPRTTVLWLGPNVRREGDPRRKFDDTGEFALDLREVDREAEIAWLEEAFAPEMDKLRGAYATVTVKWGLHQYFM